MNFKDTNCSWVLNVPAEHPLRYFRSLFWILKEKNGVWRFKKWESAHSKSELRNYSDPVPAIASYYYYNKNYCRWGGLWPIIGPPIEEYNKVLREKINLGEDKIKMERTIEELRSKIRKLSSELEDSLQNKQQLKTSLLERDEKELKIVKEIADYYKFVENSKIEI